jgi:DNA-binding winged helix-turn-helix (wHTH) protein
MVHSSRLVVVVKASSSSPAIFRFGVFELDPRAGELRKKGMKIRLQGQPVEILVMLLEKPGEIVTREELQKRLWPADTFVDFDHGLNSAIKRLRQALDEDAETPRFIETLPRHGYRFIGSVNGPALTSGTVIGDDRRESATKEEHKLQSELFLAYHYMLGQGHLLAHHGKEAAEEFQKVIDHHGMIANFLLSTLAHLGMARAYTFLGETGKSRAAYEEFFAHCESANSDTPVIQQAKLECARLR